MAQRLTDTDGRSPAARALDEAIESSIAGNPVYPTGATFIDADDPSLGTAIRLAVDQGGAVVIAYPDGATRVLRPERAATAL
jgi:hypothetical protein